MPTENPSLFVGGLPTNVLEGEVQGLFAQYGTVSSIHLKKGYAFIKFLEPDAAYDACSLDGSLYGTKVLAVRIQAPENMKPKLNLNPLPPVVPGFIVPVNPSLFIGALPKEITEQDLLTLLTPYGTVASISIKKGYAFATFVEPEAAHVACALDGLLYGDRPLAVRIQSPENMKKEAPTAAPLVLPTVATHGASSLFLGGLPHNTTEATVLSLAQPYGPIRSVALHKGYAFVNYDGPGCAELASLYLNNMELAGKRLAARPQVQQPLASPPIIRAPSTIIPNASPAEARSISRRLPSQPLLPKNHPSLFVGGLQSIATEREVKLLFSPYGNIVKLTMCKGYCFIDYEKPGCAEKAVAALDGFVMDGKPLGVRIQDESHRKPRQESEKKTPRFHPY